MWRKPPRQLKDKETKEKRKGKEKKRKEKIKQEEESGKGKGKKHHTSKPYEHTKDGIGLKGGIKCTNGIGERCSAGWRPLATGEGGGGVLIACIAMVV